MPNEERTKCIALTYQRLPCTKWSLSNKQYCQSHNYWNELTPEKIKKIRYGGMNVCTNCNHFHEEASKQCHECHKKALAKHHAKPKSKKCPWFDRHHNPCNLKPIENSEYCEPHQYVAGYTPEMKEQSHYCSGCSMWKYTGEFSICEKCRKRFADDRKKPKKVVEKTKCAGYTKGPKECYKNPEEGSNYCKVHAYFNNFTEEEIDEISNGIWFTCSRSNHWKKTDGGLCDKCKEERRHDYQEKKVDKTKCDGTDRNGQKCRNSPIGDTGYCKYHDYMIGYTDEQKANLRQCSTCLMYKYLGDYDTCDGEFCRGQEKKEYDGPTCLLESCNFKPKENGYCGKHERYGWKKTVEADGAKKVCADWGHRGCSNILNIDDKSKCEDCLKKDREEDQVRRDKIKAEAKEFNNKDPMMDLDEEIYIEDLQAKLRKCPGCGQDREEASFIDHLGKAVENCKVCRNKWKKQDAKRPRRKRDWKGEMDRNPERKAKKEKWKEENWDKMAGYWLNYRGRKIENLGVEEYHRIEAERMKKYRAEHPEMCKASNEKKKRSPVERYKYYIRTAINKGIKWNLTFNQAKELFLDNCYYCGEPACENVVLNGIDRKDNDLDYDLENTVSCCAICNYMKGDRFDDTEFIQVCEHICANLGLINGELHPELFSDSLGTPLDKYKHRANNKKLSFNLTDDQFYKLRNGNCYLCGKETSKTNINGIDRVINELGYLINNSKSCCHTCNFLKREYSLSCFLQKIYEICLVHLQNKLDLEIKQKIFEFYKNIITTTIDEDFHVKIACKDNKHDNTLSMQKYRDRKRLELGDQAYREMRRFEKAKQQGRVDEDGNIIIRQKMTKEQKQQRNRERQQRHREALKERYGDEEYKKMHAQKMAEQRRKKKIT